MKKILSLLAVLSLVFSCVCGSAYADEQVEKQITFFDEDQLKEYSEAFEMVKDGKVNVLCCFLMSDYEKIEDMDFGMFLHNFPDGEDLKDGREYEALKGLSGWVFGDTAIEDMIVPIHKYTRAAVDAALEKHGNISSDELTVGKEFVPYLEEYDSFYNFTSDFALDGFNCTAGETDGEIITLYSDKSGGRETLKIKESEEGDIVILSHTTDKMAGLANPWIDCDTLAEAEELAGFTLDMSERTGGYKAEVFRVIPERLLEIRYKDGDSEVMVRKAPGEGQDISGDYNSYEKIETADENGFRLTYNYLKNGGMIVLLSGNDYSYCISAYEGFTGDCCADFVNAIVK